jgi:hypothetical protein
MKLPNAASMTVMRWDIIEFAARIMLKGIGSAQGRWAGNIEEGRRAVIPHAR